MNNLQSEKAIYNILESIGEDATRDGLRETPLRVAKSYQHLFSGYGKDPKLVFKTFDDPCEELVLLRGIEWYSFCEHHMLPFFGTAHIAYIPNGKVIGISKLARLLEIFTRRLQIQERIGQQVTESLMKYLDCKGAACILTGLHLCMVARGVEKQNSTMVTSSLTGVFKDNISTRAELFSLIKGV